jgi:hypothetical protein
MGLDPDPHLRSCRRFDRSRPVLQLSLYKNALLLVARWSGPGSRLRNHPVRQIDVPRFA